MTWTLETSLTRAELKCLGILQLPAVPAASLWASESTSSWNAFDHHLAQRAKIYCYAFLQPHLKHPWEVEWTATVTRLFSCAWRNGMLRLRVAELGLEGSKMWQGVGRGADCWTLRRVTSERTAPWVLHKNPKGSSGFFPILVNSAWLLSSFSSACVSLTFGAGLPESRLGQKQLHVSYFAMCIHKGYPMPVTPTQGSK